MARKMSLYRELWFQQDTVGQRLGGKYVDYEKQKTNRVPANTGPDPSSTAHAACSGREPHCLRQHSTFWALTLAGTRTSPGFPNLGSACGVSSATRVLTHTEGKDRADQRQQPRDEQGGRSRTLWPQEPGPLSACSPGLPEQTHVRAKKPPRVTARRQWEAGVLVSAHKNLSILQTLWLARGCVLLELTA